MELGFRLFLEDERRELEKRKEILLQELGKMSVEGDPNNDINYTMKLLDEVGVKLMVIHKELQKLGEA